MMQPETPGQPAGQLRYSLAMRTHRTLFPALWLTVSLLWVGSLVGAAQAPGPRPPMPPAATASTTGTTPAQDTRYVCPMHPDVIEAAPGACPRCGMTLVPGNPLGTANYHLHVETVPGVVKAGQPTTFRFHVEDPVSHTPVTDYAVVHDMPYHVFVLSRDTSVFMHEHPVRQPDGVFALTVTLPKPGHYVMISDFFPVGGSGQVLLTPIVTAGFDGDVQSQVPTLALDTSWTKREGGVIAELRTSPTALVASEDLDLPLHFVDEATGQPVRDLQRYLGAFGHALIVNEELTEYIHAHPEETLEGTDIQDGGGPDVTFHTLFPKAGRYKAWVQFKRGGKLSTVSFTFRVLRQGETITGGQ